jgi:cation:H+ antiporter
MVAAILSEQWIASLAEWPIWLMSVCAIVGLVFGSDKAVSAAVRLARLLGMPAVIVGATIVSLGTTAPETCVSVMAAYSGNPGLALGNGIGSIICNMALIFGLCCCVCTLPKDRFILRRHGWLQFGAGMLLTGTIYVLAIQAGGVEGIVLPRWLGWSFCFLLLIYLGLSVHWSRQHPSQAIGDAREHTKGKTAARLWAEVSKDLFFLCAGLGLVVVSADVLVGNVGEICLRYGVPSDILAVTLIAFGTSLPELVTGITAIAKGHPELLVGNIIGANVLNILFVVGASSSVADLSVPSLFLYLHLPVMMASLILFCVYIAWPGKTFRRWQGIPLLALFAGYYIAISCIL